ncbi:hypothetical protein ACNGHC_00685 [Campylobacter jejuni]|uniref:hypothetical protein n=1 Tax=Campylobacter jejuni TaxID=197 RepID=UPI0019B84E99|nr:hypothetical protein [Campylobacter jejuni]EFU2166420.1 hypothetical protein [Campylobacter jejuni]EIO6372192.1 hypothetical protein [Campylobacter jejuni]ELJ5966337.1 hypothetical protein [Campylobacter jejuni]
MKLVDKLKKAYDYKKELYKAEKGSSSKEYHIENRDIPRFYRIRIIAMRRYRKKIFFNANL